MKRKFLMGVALLTSAVIMLAGCGKATGGSETSQEGANDQSVSAEDNTAAGNGDKVTLKLWIPQENEIDYETCAMTQYLEEKFNVNLDFDVYTHATDRDTAFNLLIAGEEYPDIFTGQFSPNQITMAAEAGAVIPLNEYMTEDSAYKQAFEANKDWDKVLLANDGNIYTFVYSDIGVHKDSEYKMWYNVEMLKNLGWDAPPATPEEFKQYLIALRDLDANGNGDPTDEIPLMGDNAGRKTDPICFLMNPFELYTDNFYYITDDNEVYFSAVTDGWREGLKYIADLYAEGLIAEETYIQDQSTYKGYLNKEEPVIGMTPDWYIGSEIDRGVVGPFDYLAVEPLKGEHQQSAARIGGQVNPCCMISSTCKYPELAYEILDFMCSDEGGILDMWGIEGETFEYVDGENFLGKSPSFQLTVDSILDYLWNPGISPRVDSQELRYGSYMNEAEIEKDNTYELLSAAKVYEPYYVNHHTPDYVWLKDDELIQKVSDYKAQIEEYIRTTDTQFIMGRLDINDDGAWQNYLDELNRMGLQEYIEALYQYYGLK